MTRKKSRLGHQRFLNLKRGDDETLHVNHRMMNVDVVKEKIEEVIVGVRGKIPGRPTLIFIFIFYILFIIYILFYHIFMC